MAYGTSGGYRNNNNIPHTSGNNGYGNSGSVNSDMVVFIPNNGGYGNNNNIPSNGGYGNTNPPSHGGYGNTNPPSHSGYGNTNNNIVGTIYLDQNKGVAPGPNTYGRRANYNGFQSKIIYNKRRPYRNNRRGNDGFTFFIPVDIGISSEYYK